MASLLDGEVAVVTGGSSGMGRSMATLFAENGADVIVADVREEPREGGMPTHEKIREETDSRAKYVECDVSKVDNLEMTVDATEEFGGIDVMVNNAAMHRPENFLEVTEEEYDRLMDINLKGVFFGCQYAAKQMVKKGTGSIINISSLAGYRGSSNSVTYSASKGGVRLLTYALAGAIGPEGVRVNAIHPGLTETMLMTEDVPVFGTDRTDEYLEKVPLGRWAQPDDIAKAALFLASDLSKYVTGESLIVDGGSFHTS